MRNPDYSGYICLESNLLFMDAAAFKEKLQQLVAGDQLSEAAEALAGFWKKKHAGLEALALAQLRRLKTLQTEQRKGTVSDNDAFVERAKVTDALLLIIGQTDAGKPTVPEALKAYLPPKPAFQPVMLVLIAAFFMAVAFITYRAFFTGPEDFTLALNFMESGDESKLVNQGKARIILGSRPMDVKAINAEGRIFYEQIPASALNDSVRVVVIDMPYRVTGQSAYTAAKSRSIAVSLEPVQDTLSWRGTVIDAGGKPIEHAVIDVENGLAKGQTDAMGHFRIAVPGKAGDQVQTVVLLNGKVVRNARFTLSETAPPTIVLDDE